MTWIIYTPTTNNRSGDITRWIQEAVISASPEGGVDRDWGTSIVMAAMMSAAAKERGMLRSSMTIATLSTSIIEHRRRL
jgi:hypothetical protein